VQQEAMKKSNVIVNSECGLHARPASILVSTALRFSSSILIKKNDKTANCKSILSVLSIGASNGDELEIVIEGQDEADAFNTMKDLFDLHLTNA
jgi:phosphocarrier protein